jgi:hypothetical protein
MNILSPSAAWTNSKRGITMADDMRRARIMKEFEKEFLPEYDAVTMPSADKRAAYALEHIAFRMVVSTKSSNGS